jgi:hypothetical protein
MNQDGQIRQYDLLSDDKIDVTKDIKDVERLSIKARKEYYRAIKQGLSNEGALACANFVERERLTR